MVPSDISNVVEDLPYSLKHISSQHLHSVFIVLPVASAYEDLHSSISELQASHDKIIRILKWDLNQIEVNFGEFVDSMLKRMEVSKDCWLFMNLRSSRGRIHSSPKFTPNLLDEVFGAWKENADSVLSFHPYVDLRKAEDMDTPFISVDENKRQAPFYHGGAFMHPVRFNEKSIRLLRKSFTYSSSSVCRMSLVKSRNTHQLRCSGLDAQRSQVSPMDAHSQRVKESKMMSQGAPSSSWNFVVHLLSEAYHSLWLHLI